MTLATRISIARTLTIVQLVLSLAIAIVMTVIVVAVAFAMATDASAPFPALLILGVVAVMSAMIIVLSIVLPWIVLNALKKRQEKWATAAFVSLIVQIVIGGGFFSLFPIVTLILLLNKEASAYIGMK